MGSKPSCYTHPWDPSLHATLIHGIQAFMLHSSMGMLHSSMGSKPSCYTHPWDPSLHDSVIAIVNIGAAEPQSFTSGTPSRPEISHASVWSGPTCSDRSMPWQQRQEHAMAAATGAGAWQQQEHAMAAAGAWQQQEHAMAAAAGAW